MSRWHTRRGVTTTMAAT